MHSYFPKYFAFHRFSLILSEFLIDDAMMKVANDPESSPRSKSCAMKDLILINTNNWIDAHLASCRSYQRKNHLGKRLMKLNSIYSRVFGCVLLSTSTTTSTTTSTITSTPSPTCIPGKFISLVCVLLILSS